MISLQDGMSAINLIKVMMVGQVITVRCTRVVCCMPPGHLRSSNHLKYSGSPGDGESTSCSAVVHIWQRCPKVGVCW